VTLATDKTQENATTEQPEAHSYLRHNMQLWVQWFSFFVTVNYVALGWFASDITHHKIEDRMPLIVVATFFSFQCLLGIWVSLRLRVWFNETGNQSGAEACPDEGTATKHGNPSASFYAFAVLLGCFALGSIVLIWTLLSFFGAIHGTPAFSAGPFD
jgi:hypothetical protein